MMNLKDRKRFLNESFDDLFGGYDFSKIKDFKDLKSKNTGMFTINFNDSGLHLQNPFRDMSIKINYDPFDYTQVKDSSGNRIVNLKEKELNSEVNEILYKAQVEIAKLMLDFAEDLETNKDKYFTK